MHKHFKLNSNQNYSCIARCWLYIAGYTAKAEIHIQLMIHLTAIHSLPPTNCQDAFTAGAVCLQGFRLQMLNSSAYVAGPLPSFQQRLPSVQRQLLRIAQAHTLPDLDIYIEQDDAPSRPKDGEGNCSLGPIIVPTKKMLPVHSHTFLAPDFSFQVPACMQCSGGFRVRLFMQMRLHLHNWVCVRLCCKNLKVSTYQSKGKISGGDGDDVLSGCRTGQR